MPPPGANVTKQSKTAWTPVMGATVSNTYPQWTRVYSPPPLTAGARNAAVIMPNGWMIQCYNDGGSIKARRMANPHLSTNWAGAAWSTVATGISGRPVALSTDGTNVFLFYVDLNGADDRVQVIASANNGSSWGAATAIATLAAGNTVGGLAAHDVAVVIADNYSASYRFGIAVYSAGWGAVSWSSTDTKKCNGCSVRDVDGEYMVIFNHQTTDDVQRIKKIVYSGSWGSIVTLFENYNSTDQDLTLPSFSYDGDNGFFYGVFIREDSRTGTTVYRINLFYSESGTYWLEPIEVLDQNHSASINMVFDGDTGGYWVVSHNHAWYWAGPTSTDISSSLIAYNAEMRPLSAGPGEGGNEIEVWLDNRGGDYIDNSVIQIGSKMLLSRWYPNTAGAGRVMSGYVAAIRRFGVDRQSSRVRLLLIDPFRYDRQAPTRITWTGQTAQTIISDLAARAEFGGIVGFDSASSIWSQTITEFALRRNESFRSAIVRILTSVGGRGYMYAGALYVVSETSRTVEYTFGPNDHPLLPGSWVEERRGPTVHEARGVGGIYGVQQDWDRIEQYGGYLTSTLDTYLDTQTQVTNLADRRLRFDTSQAINGQLVVAPNIYALPLDWVTVSDSLAGVSAVTYQIERVAEQWNSQANVWRQTLTLGGIVS